MLSSDAVINFVSSSAEELTGYAAPELVGRPVIYILEDESAFGLTRMLNEAEENGCWEGDIVHRRRDGRRLPARGAISTLTAQSDTGYILLSNMSDDAELAADERPLIAGVADVLRTYSHDLNNPLTVMMGFTQLLLLNESCSGKMKSDVEKIYAELQRVVGIVSQMHEYAYSLYEKSPQTR